MATPIEKVYSIRLAVQGENATTPIEIDMTTWAEEFPNASFYILFKPYNTTDVVPVITEYVDHILRWVPTIVNTAIAGVGYTEVRAIDSDTGLIKKSRIIPTSVENSVSGYDGIEPPSPATDWVNAVLESKNAAENAANTAIAQTGIIDQVILIQDEEPTAEHNKLYIKKTPSEAVEVATEDELTALRTEVQGDLAEIQEDVQGVETDVAALQTDVQALQATTEAMQGDVDELSIKVNGKLDTPQTAGTSGQVLTSDGQGGQTWQTPSGGSSNVQDVQVGGTSILNAQGVANVPFASASDFGAVKVGPTLTINSSGLLVVDRAGGSTIKEGTVSTKLIPASLANYSAFYGLAKVAGSDEKNSTLPLGTYTESAKSAISEMLNGSVAVSGTTPVIAALPGLRYVCGEVSTISITPPASGICDVLFTSGSTAAVLTVPSSIKWPDWFDPDNLDANTTYEINIMDGLGAVGVWS